MTTQEQDIWEQKYKREITAEEQRMIKDNLVSFFETLREWQTQEAADG